MRIENNNDFRMTDMNITKRNSSIEIPNKLDFSTALREGRQQLDKKELREKLSRIRKKGLLLSSRKCYRDVEEYKSMIKEYLEYMVDYMYSVNQNISFWETQYFTTVDIVNSRLEELTKQFLEEEKENIDVAATIDNIQGLLLNVLR